MQGLWEFGLLVYWSAYMEFVSRIDVWLSPNLIQLGMEGGP